MTLCTFLTDVHTYERTLASELLGVKMGRPGRAGALSSIAGRAWFVRVPCGVRVPLRGGRTLSWLPLSGARGSVLNLPHSLKGMGGPHDRLDVVRLAPPGAG